MDTFDRASKIGIGEKIAYGLGDAGSNLVWATLASFMTFFYTDIFGISAAVVGTLLLVSRIFDAFSDFAMGILIDRTHTRFGKARPWLLIIAVPYGLAAVLLFTVPDFGMTGKIIYAFITYNFMSTVCYTIYNMPFGTLTSLMTQDQYERSILTLLRMFSGVLVALIVSNITLPLVTAFGGGAKGWQLTNVIYGACATIIILITFFFTKERVTPVKKEKISTKVALKTLLANKYWKMVLVLGLLTFILFGLPGATIYYAQYVLLNTGAFGLIMTLTYGPNIIMFVLLAPLIKKFSKRSLVLWGFVFYTIGTIILASSPLNLTNIYIGSCIKAIGFAPLVGTMFTFVADTIEYGEWKTGVRSEGLLYSAASFGQKVGTGISLALIGWVLDWGGYIANTEVQSASAINSIQLLFIYIPWVVYLLAAVLLLFYKLDKEYPQIIEELKLRAQINQ